MRVRLRINCSLWLTSTTGSMRFEKLRVCWNRLSKPYRTYTSALVRGACVHLAPQALTLDADAAPPREEGLPTNKSQLGAFHQHYLSLAVLAAVMSAVISGGEPPPGDKRARSRLSGLLQSAPWLKNIWCSLHRPRDAGSPSHKLHTRDAA